MEAGKAVGTFSTISSDSQSRSNHIHGLSPDEYQGWIKSLARKACDGMGLPRSMQDDLVSAGYFGLIEAARRYHRREGIRFKSYAYPRVYGAMIDCLRKQSQFSARAYRYAKAFRASLDARQSISREGARASESPAKASLARVLEYASQGALALRLSLDNATERGLLADDSNDPEVALQARQQRDSLCSIIEKLPANERHIVTEYYFKGRSFCEIAKDNDNCSKGWVSKLHRRALSRMKDHLEQIQAEEEVLAA